MILIHCLLADLGRQGFHSLWNGPFLQPDPFEVLLRSSFAGLHPPSSDSYSITTSIIFFWVLHLLFSCWCICFAMRSLQLEGRDYVHVFHA